MALSFGNMFASLTLESASFMSGIEAARKSIANTQKQFATVGGQMQKIGAVMSVGITAPFIATAQAAMDGALAQRQAMAQVTTALDSMGPVAGRTAEQLAKAADAIEMRSMVDADVILTKVTANLLTFGNVAGTVFDRAQQAAVDMAQRLGQDPQAAALMLGKALNDPIKGITALTRVGISFSASQVATIKQMAATGQTAKAQGMILAEVERQFGGAAQAAANTDPYRQMNVAFGQMADVLGEVALNVVPPLTNGLKVVADAFLALPPSAQTTTIAVIAVGAAIGPVVATVGTLVTGVGALLPVLAKVPAALALMRTAIMVQAIPSIVALMTSLSPILLPIAAVSAAVLGVVLAVKHWDTIKVYVDRVIVWVQQLYTGVKTWVLDKLNAVWSSVVDKVKGVGDAFFRLYDAVVGHSYVPDMVDGIAAQMARLDAVMVAPATGAVGKVSAAFKAMADELRPLLDELFPEARAMRELDSKLALIERARKAGAADGGLSGGQADEARRRLVRGDSDDGAAAVEIVDPASIFAANDAIGDLAKQLPDLRNVASDTAGAVVESFASMAHGVLDAIGGISDRLRSKDWLGALEGVIGVFTQLGGQGVFGSKLQSTIKNASVLGGRRALGGPVATGKVYEVGERGREWFMPNVNGRIVANDALDAANDRPIIIELAADEGAMFVPRVNEIADGRARVVVREKAAFDAKRSRNSK